LQKNEGNKDNKIEATDVGKITEITDTIIDEGSPMKRYKQIQPHIRPMQITPFSNPERQPETATRNSPSHEPSISANNQKIANPSNQIPIETPQLRSTRARKIIPKRCPDMFYY